MTYITLSKHSGTLCRKCCLNSCWIRRSLWKNAGVYFTRGGSVARWLLNINELNLPRYCANECGVYLEIETLLIFNDQVGFGEIENPWASLRISKNPWCFALWKPTMTAATTKENICLIMLGRIKTNEWINKTNVQSWLLKSNEIPPFLFFFFFSSSFSSSFSSFFSPLKKEKVK